MCYEYDIMCFLFRLGSDINTYCLFSVPTFFNKHQVFLIPHTRISRYTKYELQYLLGTIKAINLTYHILTDINSEAKHGTQQLLTHN